ncbi:hypothetical protein GE061_017589 [Apolygus lucorum]|uniref:F-box domain-containing protein n=1 Tax=Apolygus lucorum TaxID=248454 RepID=A0A8S9XE29_APOLU|nr:hypothetical protein GE061_017589 [Apolygus lucorum]
MCIYLIFFGLIGSNIWSGRSEPSVICHLFKMPPVLPPEVLMHIFSYLDLEELMTARHVCRSWWEVIDCDRLWKPQLLKRRINLDSVKLENAGSEHEPEFSSQWAQLASAYYGTLSTNWENNKNKSTKFSRSTRGVAIRVPYMIKTFNLSRIQFVEVMRLVNGDFVVDAHLPLPVDQYGRHQYYDYDEYYEPCMNTDNVFAVTLNTTTVIFKRSDGRFSFAKAVQFSGFEPFFSSLDTSETPQFIFMRNRAFSCSCCCVTDDTLWLEVTDKSVGEKTVFVWDYASSKLLLMVDVRQFIGCSDDYVFLMTCEGGLTIHSFNGTTLWSGGSEVLLPSVCWNKLGCAFIDIKEFPAVEPTFIELPKLTVRNIGVAQTIAIALHETDQLAYCLRRQDSAAHITCISLRHGGVLWDAITSATWPSDSSMLFRFKLKVIMGKYVAVYAFNDSRMVGDRNKHYLYSTSGGKYLGCVVIDSHSTIQYSSDEFVITRTWGIAAWGNLGVDYQLYNFLLQKEEPSQPTETVAVQEDNLPN